MCISPVHSLGRAAPNPETGFGTAAPSPWRGGFFRKPNKIRPPGEFRDSGDLDSGSAGGEAMTQRNILVAEDEPDIAQLVHPAPVGRGLQRDRRR